MLLLQATFLLPALAYAQAELPFLCSEGTSGATISPSACNSVASSYSACGPKTQRGDCVCNQNFLNNIVDCESEIRICLDSTYEDNSVQQVLANWHRECDGQIHSSLTTPVLSTISTPVGNLAGCSQILSVCHSAGKVLLSCEEAYYASSNLPQLSNCECRSSLLSAASVCNFDGNVTCFNVPATLSQVPLFQACPEQAAQFHAASSATNTQVVISASNSAGPQPGSASTAVTQPTQSSVSGASGASRLQARAPARFLKGVAALYLVKNVLIL